MENAEHHMAVPSRHDDAIPADSQDAASIFRANTHQEAQERGLLSSETPSNDAQLQTNKPSRGALSQGLQTELNSVTVAATNKNCYNADGIGREGDVTNPAGEDIVVGRIVVDLQSSRPSEGTSQKGDAGRRVPPVGRLKSGPTAGEIGGAKGNPAAICPAGREAPGTQPQQAATPKQTSSAKKGSRLLSLSQTAITSGGKDKDAPDRPAKAAKRASAMNCVGPVERLQQDDSHVPNAQGRAPQGRKSSGRSMNDETEATKRPQIKQQTGRSAQSEQSGK